MKGCVYQMVMIYLDNAATTMKKPPCVAEAVTAAMTSLGNAGRGAHAATLGAARTIYDTRARLAGFFHAEDPRQVVFTCNSTEALNTAIKGLLSPEFCADGRGVHVVSTVLEHNSVLRPLYELEKRGVRLSFAGCDPEGRLNYDELESLICEDTRAIVCTHGSNLTGNLVDLKRVGKAAHEQGLLFIADASQTAGVFPIDVQELGIDVLCFTGHKSMLGPQGTGGMAVRKGLMIHPLKSGGTGVQTYNKEQPSEMPTHLEAGTLNGHGIAGLDAAVEYIESTGIDTIRRREQALMRRFYEGIRDVPGVRILGDFETEERCPIVSINIGQYDSSEVADELYTEYGICVRPGAHCAPLMHEALGTVEQGAVRFSFSHFNTEEEIDQAVRAVRELA